MFTEVIGICKMYMGIIVLMSVNPGSPYEEAYREELKPVPVIEDCKTAVIEKSELLMIKSFNEGSPVIRKLACVLIEVNCNEL